MYLSDHKYNSLRYISVKSIIFAKERHMAKGRQVSQLYQAVEDNSLEPTKGLDSIKKAPGQVGLHNQHSIDGIRRAKPEDRIDKGEKIFVDISMPKIAEQTYDCYNPIRKVSAPKKKKD